MAIKNEPIQQRKAAIVCKKYINTGALTIVESFGDVNDALAYAFELDNHSASTDNDIDYIVMSQDHDDYSNYSGCAMVCFEANTGDRIFQKCAFDNIKSARTAAVALDASAFSRYEYFIMVEHGTKIEE